MGLHGTLHGQTRKFMSLYRDGSVTVLQSRLMEFLSYQIGVNRSVAKGLNNDTTQEDGI